MDQNGEPIPRGGIDRREVLEAAFTGGPYGEHRLRAVMREPRRIDGPIPEVALPVERHVEIRGHFLDRQGRRCGRFRRCIYRHGRTGDLEVWFGGLFVEPSRRGGMMAFPRRNVRVCAANGVRRVRGTAGQTIGGYVWAREGFAFDAERLPGFGADERGLGRGGEHMSLPLEGDDLARVLVRGIVEAARRDRRITRGEAELLLRLELDSPSAMARFGDLSRRLLTGARWPLLLELTEPE